jgi:hypothetical protein
VTANALQCEDRRRRQEVRRNEKLNGLDYLEVAEDQRSLTVYFLDKAPADLKKENLQIRGGRRVTRIRVIGIDICRNEDPERDDCLHVRLDKPGDFTCYELCVVALDKDGRPTGERHPAFDPRYACLSFSFKAGCPSDLDCTPLPCLTRERRDPEINYLAKDYASFRQLILDRLALLVPEWQERHLADLGIAVVELLAYVGDHLSYYQDAVATEAYLDTARLRISVRRHGRLVDYALHEGCNARAFLHIAGDSDLELDLTGLAFVTSLDGLLQDPPGVVNAEVLRDVPSSAYEWFEAATPRRIKLWKTHNEIRFYTWGDAECCIPAGATRATLCDYDETVYGSDGEARAETTKPEPPPRDRNRILHLDPAGGDVLVFEEIRGPRTGNAADADPAKRHVVRLTKAEPSVDPLYDKPVVEVEWAEADALPFPLCVSAIGPAPACELLPISVVRGNVILIDHGRTGPPDDLGEVPCIESMATCQGCPDDPVQIAGRFRPQLARAPLTFREPLAEGGPAKDVLDQDPRRAAPAIGVWSTSPGETRLDWTPVPDLISSQPGDAHFVVEVDNDGFGHLRFGDGELGRAPEAGHAFRARYRVGSGPAGNVGADSIVHVVTPGTFSGVGLRPRNPLPARGGTAPEPIEEAKAFAPFAFREQLERAVTPQDYVDLAKRDFAQSLQGAAARLRWTGSWYAVELAVDSRGSAEADEALLGAVERGLERYRRIAHDLQIEAAASVPLEIRLRVCLQPHFSPGHVKAELLDAFGNRVLPDGKRGFFHPDNLTFGEGVSVSRLVAAARQIAGVENVVVTKLQRFAGPDEGAIADGLLKLAPFEVARLDNDPSFPENGVLGLDLRRSGP